MGNFSDFTFPFSPFPFSRFPFSPFLQGEYERVREECGSDDELSPSIRGLDQVSYFFVIFFTLQLYDDPDIDYKRNPFCLRTFANTRRRARVTSFFEQRSRSLLCDEKVIDRNIWEVIQWKQPDIARGEGV